MILIIGAGVAGLTAARAACALGADVTLVTSGTLAQGDHCNTVMAQGGIAAAIGAGDRALAHLVDTVTAGAGLVDAEAARVLVDDGVDYVQRLLTEKFAADRGPSGELSLGLEGAHSAHRILHAGGDRTGAVLYNHLSARLPAEVRVMERTDLEQLVMYSGAVTGAVVRADGGVPETILADAVVLATGGYAALYDRTSNFSGARGTGVSVAADAGALVADLEFVQFHPTVLAGTGQLISEAVRGAGAVLIDGAGSRFMVERHDAAELASRDIVSREIHRVLRETGEERVWLDARPIEAKYGVGSLARLFPGIDSAVHEHGLDWTREPVPVAPAAHYTMGGVATDVDGRSSLPGLLVAGEAAATGVHGANRLASNSLLEGLVFGSRAAAAAVRYSADREWKFSGSAMKRLLRSAECVSAHEPHKPERSRVPMPHIGRLMSRQLGIEREENGMITALNELSTMPGRESRLATLVAHAALARTESRGGHQRSDHPGSDPSQAQRRALKVLVSTPTPPNFDIEPARRSLAPC